MCASSACWSAVKLPSLLQILTLLIAICSSVACPLTLLMRVVLHLADALFPNCALAAALEYSLKVGNRQRVVGSDVHWCGPHEGKEDPSCVNFVKWRKQLLISGHAS